MKILQVLETFSPSLNGTVKLVYQLSRALLKKGHDIEIYTTDLGWNIDHKLEHEFVNFLQGIKIHSFHIWLKPFDFRCTPGLITKVKKELKNFDIIHLHGFRGFQSIVIHHHAKISKVPYIIDAHGSVLRMGKKSLKCLFDITFGYRILKDASKVVAETRMGINEYKRMGVKEEKIILLPPPLLTEDFSHLPPYGLFRQKFNIKDKRIVMFLGRIHQIKGLDFLVESFSELIRRRDNVLLVIVGYDDGYKPTLEKIIKKLGLLNKVLFTGFLDGEEKLSALVDADVFVQTSRYEQGAWAPFEAVLCNTPIIVSSNSGAGEDVRMIDAGYLVEWGNKKELSETIEYVLDNSEEAYKKTKKAKEYLEINRSMSRRVLDYEELYKKCIEEWTSGENK